MSHVPVLARLTRQQALACSALGDVPRTLEPARAWEEPRTLEPARVWEEPRTRTHVPAGSSLAGAGLEDPPWIRIRARASGLG